jgi:hypothetical protein
LVELVRTTYRESETPFSQICDHLLGYYYEQQWARDQELIMHPRRMQVVTQEGDDGMVQGEDSRMAAYGQQRNNDLHVSDAFWKGATPEEQDVLRQLRTKIKARLQAKREYPERPSTLRQDGDIMKAHANKAVAVYYPEDTDDDDVDSAVEQLGIIENKMRSIFGG